MWLKDIYIDTAKEHGYKPAPEHLDYLLKAFVADTDEKAQEIGCQYMWTDENRMKGPAEPQRPARIPVPGGAKGETAAASSAIRRRYQHDDL